MRMLSRCLAVACLLGAVGLIARAQESPTVYRPGNGVTLPTVLKEVHPTYTKEAMDARIEGTVVLDAVVLADGAVGNVAVTRSLDTIHGLDGQAVSAMKQWQFKPGMKDDKPVAVQIAVEMNFTLK